LKSDLIESAQTTTQPLPICVPKCRAGIGDVIVLPDSAKLIDGVRLAVYPVWPDDRGYFMEVLRMGQGIASDFHPATTQISAALTYPGAIKAFHYHLEQADYWVPAQGMFQVVLVDFRPQSPTYGAKNTMYVGALRPWQILIPPGVGHGYKVIGTDPAMLVYVTNRFYNPQDEGRVPWNHPDIAYDWELQHK
jgi:dTDP-4-dehydrorhamnose 3,5-epimerase